MGPIAEMHLLLPIGEGRSWLKATCFTLMIACMATCLCGCATKGDRLLAELIREQLRRDGAEEAEEPSTGLIVTDSSENQPMPPREKLTMIYGSRRMTIQPESVVEIVVEEDTGLNGMYEVNPSSAIQFKYVGLLFLVNMTAEEAERKIESILVKTRGFRSATVTVRIVKSSYDRIRVSGGVMAPSDLKIGPGSTITLSEALRRAQGLRPQAKGAKIKVIRGGLLSPFGPAADGEEYDLIGKDGKPRVPNVKVSNNDWIHVFQGADGVGGEKQITLFGEVRRPGVWRFQANEPCTMMYLMFKTGGLPKWADDKNVVIVRKGPAGIEEQIIVNVRLLLKTGDPLDDVPLQNGDRVIVKERRLLSR